MARREMRWFGWGDPAHVSHGLPDGALELLRARVGLADVPRPPFPADAVRLPAPIEFDIPHVELRTDHEARLLRAGGKSYPDLVRMRSGSLDAAPDAVAAVRSADDVRAVLGAGVAVVPFGGGTSVVGGVEPLRGGTLRWSRWTWGRWTGCYRSTRARGIAVFEPGIAAAGGGARPERAGPHARALPAELRVRDGRWLRGDALGRPGMHRLRAHRLDGGRPGGGDAGGRRRPLTVPASAAGPDLRELFMGSEGVLGVLTRIALRVRPLPATRRYEGFMFGSFEQGCEAFRALEHEGVAPHVARLSDETETEVTFAMAGREGSPRDLARATCAPAAWRVAAWRSSAGRGRWTASRTPGGSMAVLRRHGAVGARPLAGPGVVARRDSTGRTCATTCWSAA